MGQSGIVSARAGTSGRTVCVGRARRSDAGSAMAADRPPAWRRRTMGRASGAHRAIDAATNFEQGTGE